MNWYKRAIKINKDEVLEIDGLISDMAEDVYENLREQILVDVRAYYSGSDLPSRKVYRTDINPTFGDYVLTVDFIVSGNMTYVNSASQNYMSIKVYRRESTENSEEQVGKLSRELSVLYHELSHYFLKKKRTIQREQLYYKEDGRGFRDYFSDPEELVSHCRDIWRNILIYHKNTLSYSIPSIEALVKRKVESLPSMINSPYEMTASERNVYVKFIMDNYVKKYLESVQ